MFESVFRLILCIREQQTKNHLIYYTLHHKTSIFLLLTLTHLQPGFDQHAFIPQKRFRFYIKCSRN